MATPDTPITRAVNLAGGQRKLALITGFSQHAVWHAIKRGQPSAAMAVRIERALKGAISAADLRPDIFNPTGD
jgi:DNA-binding transcriptional regulator YdaS (Cro superfamily)